MEIDNKTTRTTQPVHVRHPPNRGERPNKTFQSHLLYYYQHFFKECNDFYWPAIDSSVSIQSKAENTVLAQSQSLLFFGWLFLNLGYLSSLFSTIDFFFHCANMIAFKLIQDVFCISFIFNRLIPLLSWPDCNCSWQNSVIHPKSHFLTRHHTTITL